MLQQLSLSYNNVSVLQEGFLGNLTSIISLNLDHNLLANMSSVPFKSFQQGSPRIFLNNNNFTSISRVLFPSNSIIDLSYNNISVIAADMHSNWGSLSALFMSGNPAICLVKYNLLPAVFPCFDASGGNTTFCSRVFCNCAYNYVGTDVCVPEADVYLELPLLLSAYSNASVGSVPMGVSVVSGSDAFMYFQNQSSEILTGNPVLSYSVSNISSVNASFSILWTMSVFQLDFTNDSSCFNFGSCPTVPPRYIVGIPPSVALSSSIGNQFSKSLTALMNPDVPTNVSFVFRNPQCLLPGGAYCHNYSLLSVLVNSTDVIRSNSTGSRFESSTSSSTLQLSGSFSYSTKFSVEVVAFESYSNESYFIATLDVDITDCPTTDNSNYLCSGHGRCVDTGNPYDGQYTCKCFQGFTSADCSKQQTSDASKYSALTSPKCSVSYHDYFFHSLYFVSSPFINNLLLYDSTGDWIGISFAIGLLVLLLVAGFGVRFVARKVCNRSTPPSSLFLVDPNTHTLAPCGDQQSHGPLVDVQRYLVHIAYTAIIFRTNVVFSFFDNFLSGTPHSPT